MMLKMFLLKDPRTGKVEEVYDYPNCLASPTLAACLGGSSNAQLVSREPLRIPILVVPSDYLTEMENCRLKEDALYASLDLLTYWREQRDKRIEEKFKDNKLHEVRRLFSFTHAHTRSCKTMFFTGPKLVYKKTFDGNWVWKDEGILALVDVGHFRTIESLSLKGINDVFITGTFECGEEVKENTQAKITVSVK